MSCNCFITFHASPSGHSTVTAIASKCSNSISFNANERYAIACHLVLTAAFCSLLVAPAFLFCCMQQQKQACQYQVPYRSCLPSFLPAQIPSTGFPISLSSPPLHQTWAPLPFHSSTYFLFLSFLAISFSLLEALTFCSHFSLSQFLDNFWIIFAVLVYTLQIQMSQALNECTLKYVRGLLN